MNYIVITISRNGSICFVQVEQNIWKAAELAVKQSIDYGQMVQYEAIEIVDLLNNFKHNSSKSVQINNGPDFFVSIWVR